MIGRNNMMNRFFRVGLALALFAMVAGMIVGAGPVTFRIIYNNQGYPAPMGLIEGAPGVFYSVAGSASAIVFFSVTTGGTRTILGSLPFGNFFQSVPVSGPNSRFYSSTSSGGSTSNIFSVTSTPGDQHTYATKSISSALSQNLPDGTLLGVGTDGNNNWGFVRCDTNGTVTFIAQIPSGELLDSAIYASDGNYYGVAQAEYTSTGSVFRALPSGAVTTLYNFPANTFPRAVATPLLQANDGNLYGGATTGGANGTGMIYELTLGGQFTLLHSFGTGKYVAGPYTLIEASDGNLYGDAQAGDGAGQLFRITKSGQYTLLYSGLSCPCWLVQGSDGVIYGMESQGGTSGDGAVFALDAGLPKPAPRAQHLHPQSGPAGTKVRIWGYNLLSASVQFNGVPAVTVSNSGPNYVWATVPSGATSGPITVTTPGGSVTTHASFTVQ
jgi:uncharacterized repeat protein (TIGR03803 family)